MTQRHLVAGVLAALVTFGLFYTMQALISISGSGLDESKRGRLIEFVRLKKDSDLELKKRQMPDKKPPPEPPPPPDLSPPRTAARPDAGAEEESAATVGRRGNRCGRERRTCRV